MQEAVRILVPARSAPSAPVRFTPVTVTDLQWRKLSTAVPLSGLGPRLAARPASAWRSETSTDWQSRKTKAACELGARIVVPGPAPVILRLVNPEKGIARSSL